MAETRKTELRSPLVRVKTISRPSGENCGACSLAAVAVSRTGGPPIAVT